MHRVHRALAVGVRGPSNRRVEQSVAPIRRRAHSGAIWVADARYIGQQDCPAIRSRKRYDSGGRSGHIAAMCWRSMSMNQGRYPVVARPEPADERERRRISR